MVEGEARGRGRRGRRAKGLGGRRKREKGEEGEGRGGGKEEGKEREGPCTHTRRGCRAPRTSCRCGRGSTRCEGFADRQYAALPQGEEEDGDEGEGRDEDAQHRLRVLAEVAKEDRRAALFEKQEAVELLEELGRRLVDRSEDGLAVVGELAEEEHDRPRRLRVETRGRLVEEDEEGGLGGELDADREALALLDVEAHADLADERLGVRLHLEELDDLLDVGELLGLGRRARLTEEGREDEGLAHRRRRHVRVLLLAVARLALERLRERLAVDEHVARDDTDADALSEDVCEARREREWGWREERK